MENYFIDIFDQLSELEVEKYLPSFPYCQRGT